MDDIKPGDRVMIGPALSSSMYTPHDAAFGGRPVVFDHQKMRVYSWHDALPGVAKWLEAYPNGLTAVANWGTGNESGEASDYGAVSAFLAVWGKN